MFGTSRKDRMTRAAEARQERETADRELIRALSDQNRANTALAEIQRGIAFSPDKKALLANWAILEERRATLESANASVRAAGDRVRELDSRPDPSALVRGRDF